MGFYYLLWDSTVSSPLQPSDLRSPSLASNEEVVVQLRLPAVAPPLTLVGLLDLVVQAGSYGRMPRQELIISAGQGLPFAAEAFSSETLLLGGPVPPSGAHMAGDPLPGVSGLSFRGDSCHVR